MSLGMMSLGMMSLGIDLTAKKIQFGGPRAGIGRSVTLGFSIFFRDGQLARRSQTYSTDGAIQILLQIGHVLDSHRDPDQ